MGSAVKNWQYCNLALRAQHWQPRFRTECLLVDLRDGHFFVEHVVKHRGIPLGFFVGVCRVPRLRFHPSGPAID
jgi:hypothetical protein